MKFDSQIMGLMNEIGADLSKIYAEAVKNHDKALAHKVTSLKASVQQNMTEVLVELSKFEGEIEPIIPRPSLMPEEIEAIKNLPELPAGQTKLDPVIAELHEVQDKMNQEENK